MCKIVDVWTDNLFSAFDRIRRIALDYKYVSMDTEFPGVVAKPVGNFVCSSFLSYQQLQCNVNVLKIIQLGLTFSDKEGNMSTPSTWQFNFFFDIKSDMYAEESLSLLLNANLDFRRHREKGIIVEKFGELLMTSGLVLSGKIIWLSFHSFYDFGYLLKILTGNLLPDNSDEFYNLLAIFFGSFYDLKYSLVSTPYSKKGLQEIAESLKIERIGTAHQAGSDSLLTSMIFFRFKEMKLLYIPNELLSNKLYSISQESKEDDMSEETSQ